MDSGTHWVFGYGSLIFRVDFPYIESRDAHIVGWERRFWQGSHDHRGMPDAPGRVLTLTPVAGSICRGIAYLVSERVFQHLDYREKNGYQRTQAEIVFNNDESQTGTFYIADPDNHAFLGPAPCEEIAAHILRSEGPSGTNTEYLLSLAEAFRERGIEDPHIFQLERLVREGRSHPTSTAP